MKISPFNPGISLFYTSIRKIRSALTLLHRSINTWACYFSVFADPSISIAPKCSFGFNVSLKATDGGFISIQKGVSLDDNVQLIARGGRIYIGQNTFIGVGTIIVSFRSIEIGDDALIAEYVVIRDQDHLTNSRPIRLAGFKSMPIQIGDDVWIGSKASILKGCAIGSGAVIGAQALVTNDIPNDTLSVGIPARNIKNIRIG